MLMADGFGVFVIMNYTVKVQVLNNKHISREAASFYFVSDD
jgi:hypothetical protein